MLLTATICCSKNYEQFNLLLIILSSSIDFKCLVNNNANITHKSLVNVPHLALDSWCQIRKACVKSSYENDITTVKTSATKIPTNYVSTGY